MRTFVKDRGGAIALGKIGRPLLIMACVLGSGLAASCTSSSPPAPSPAETNERIRNHSDAFFEKVEQEEQQRAEEEKRPHP